MLYLCTIKDKYINIYNEFISQLRIYAKAVRILAQRLFANFAYNTTQTTGNS